MVTTHDIVKACVEHRLTGAEPDDPLLKTVVSSCKYLRTKYDFDYLAAQCPIRPIHPCLLGILKEVFSDGHVNWGRILTVLVFAGALADYCLYQKEMILAPRQICETTSEFIDEHLDSWIRRNGGWQSLECSGSNFRLYFTVFIGVLLLSFTVRCLL